MHAWSQSVSVTVEDGIQHSPRWWWPYLSTDTGDHRYRGASTLRGCWIFSQLPVVLQQRRCDNRANLYLYKFCYWYAAACRAVTCHSPPRRWVWLGRVSSRRHRMRPLLKKTKLHFLIMACYSSSGTVHLAYGVLCIWCALHVVCYAYGVFCMCCVMHMACSACAVLCIRFLLHMVHPQLP
jgi:hypothetical protein